MANPLTLDSNNKVFVGSMVKDQIHVVVTGIFDCFGECGIPASPPTISLSATLSRVPSGTPGTCQWDYVENPAVQVTQSVPSQLTFSFRGDENGGVLTIHSVSIPASCDIILFSGGATFDCPGQGTIPNGKTSCLLFNWTKNGTATVQMCKVRGSSDDGELGALEAMGIGEI